MDKPLYVVFTNRPGPGAEALIGELEVGARFVETAKVVAAVKEGACEFVELEDDGGAGAGPSSGVGWGDHPTSGGLSRLGPFLSTSGAAAFAGETLEAVFTPVFEEHFARTDVVDEALRVAMLEHLREDLESAMRGTSIGPGGEGG